MSRGCIRFPDCLPCAPQVRDPIQVIEKAEVEKVAVALYSEGRISETELTEVVTGDRKYRDEAEHGPISTSKLTRAATSSPAVRERKKRIDTRSSILLSVTTEHQKSKKSTLEKDPITLEPLDDSEGHVFQFRLSENSSVCYNVPSLVSYMVSTGDFNEPTSRMPLTDDQLDSLDQLAAEMNCGLPSVTEARKTKQKEYAANREHRDLIEGIERCLGEVVALMIEEVSKAECCDPLPLVTLFHDFDHYYTQLVSTDQNMALVCLKQYKELSIGPKNKRRKDEHGLVAILVTFIEGKIEELKDQATSTST